MATEQDLTRIAGELIDAFNARDQERFKRNLSPDVVYEEVGSQRTMKGPEGWIEAWEGWRQALPDVQGTITNAFVSGNTVVHKISDYVPNMRINHGWNSFLSMFRVVQIPDTSQISRCSTRWMERACLARPPR